MRKFLLTSLMFLLCGFTTCNKTPVPDRVGSNQLGNTVTATQAAVNDQVAGNNAAIAYTAAKLPESREKEVIQKFTDDQFRLVGFPKLTTKTDFEKTAELLLSQDAAARQRGEDARIKLSSDNQALKDKLDKAQKDFEIARKQEESDHAAALEKAREEGQEAINKLTAYIFFGITAVCMLGGVAVLILAGTYPMFGSKAAFGLFGAATVSAITGVGILQLIKQIEHHPAILWVGGGSIVAILIGVGALLYANHSHHTDNV